jgi:DNA repair protein RadA/Sms
MDERTREANVRSRAWRRLIQHELVRQRAPMASGIDQNRLSLLLAVLEKRAGLNLMGEDVFIHVARGMTIDEPAADLAVVAAVASSLRNRPIRSGTAMFGEVGLAGEVRGTSQAALRIREAALMGCTRCIVADGNGTPDDAPGCELVPVKTIREALDEAIS